MAIESIGPNKGMFYSGIALQALCVLALCYFSYTLSVHISSDYGNRKIRDGVMIVLTIVAGIGHARRFYSMPYWVVIDDGLKTLKITYLLRSPITVGRENMLLYKDTVIEVQRRSGTTTYSGFYLHLGDGRKVLFSERNFDVEDVVYVESILAYWNVEKGQDE